MQKQQQKPLDPLAQTALGVGMSLAYIAFVSAACWKVGQVVPSFNPLTVEAPMMVLGWLGLVAVVVLDGRRPRPRRPLPIPEDIDYPRPGRN